ncbi:hypothetical protein [Methylopila sp. M107]|uniref:hypothetical protein n=1 Tax=Methylopila sp. M107 TaxID=1101190 RepID=UPI00036251EB|nr:hypothetical protein [Methylopila sp. M107]
MLALIERTSFDGRVGSDDDAMLAALRAGSALRLRVDSAACTDEEADDLLARIVEIDDAIPRLRASTAAGAAVALREARRQWELHHARPGEPGHDVMSSLLAAADILGASA